MDKKYTLVQFSPEESVSALQKYEAFLTENNMDVIIASNIGEDSKLELRKVLVKRVPVEVPKVETEVVSETPVVDAPTIDAELKQPE